MILMGYLKDLNNPSSTFGYRDHHPPYFKRGHYDYKRRFILVFFDKKNTTINHIEGNWAFIVEVIGMF